MYSSVTHESEPVHFSLCQFCQLFSSFAATSLPESSCAAVAASASAAAAINGPGHRNEYVAVASTCFNLIVHPKLPDDKFIFIASVHGDLVVHFVANRAHPHARTD